MISPQSKKIAWIFLVGFMFGTVGETLLFVQRQCRRLDSMLMDDFRVVAFLTTDQTESKAKVLEERIRAISGVRDVRYVSRESALAFLQEQDPELVRSVALLGENPLHAGYEIRLLPDAIHKMPGWLQAVSDLRELDEIQYKPLELAAITQMKFYNGFLDFALSVSVLVWFIGAFASLWVALTRPETRKPPGEWMTTLTPALLGTLGGMAAIFVAALPIKPIAQMWVWPRWQAHAALAAVGMIGAALFPDMKSALKIRERHGMSSHSWAKEESASEGVGAGR